jgi:hypothetical protein
MIRAEYNAIDAINYSTLSKLHRNPKLLIAERPTELTMGQISGSLLDCFALSPQNFEEQFFLMTSKLPAEAMMNLLNQYLSLAGDDYYPIKDELVEEANKEIHYGGKWGIAVVLTKFKEVCETYLQEKHLAEDRIIVDNLLVNRAQTMANKTILNPFISSVMATKSGITANKVVIVWTDEHIVSGIPLRCKAELDNLVLEIDSGGGLNATINDLKYDSGDFLNFGDAYVKWNYHLQVAMYNRAVLGLLNSDTICDSEGIKELVAAHGSFNSIRFNFIVVNENNEPLIYPVNLRDINLGYFGGIANGVKKKGIHQLAEELLWHRETGYYDLPKDVYDREGQAELNIVYSNTN